MTIINGISLFFRKLLIRIGKVIPFLLAFILLVNYLEIIYSIAYDVTIMDFNGYLIYTTPISNHIGDMVYIDWFDVLLVYVLCFALELCKYTFRCAHLLLLNSAFRFVVERFDIPNSIIIALCVFMALCAIICLYGGIRILIDNYNKNKRNLL